MDEMTAIANPAANAVCPSISRTGHTLTVCQHAQRTRVVKDNDKERKPVDPPPVIHLDITDKDDPSNAHYLESPRYLMHCSLHHATDDRPVSNQATSPLSGTLVSSLYHLKDTNNKDGAFFVFGDISVMVEGNFRLLFSLFFVEECSNIPKMPHTRVFLVAKVLSEPFSVLPRKKFPGMLESTLLSKCFADQGVKLRIRKGSRGSSRQRPPEPNAFPYMPVNPAPEWPSACNSQMNYGNPQMSYDNPQMNYDNQLIGGNMLSCGLSYHILSPGGVMNGHQSLDKVNGYQSLDKVNGHQSLDKVNGHQPLDNVNEYQSLNNVNEYRSVNNVNEYQSLHNMNEYQSLNNVNEYQSLDKVNGHQSLDKVNGHQPLDNVNEYQSLDNANEYQSLNNVNEYQSVNNMNEYQSNEIWKSFLTLFDTNDPDS